MTRERELLQQAHDALMVCAAGNAESREMKTEALFAIRAALAAQPTQPVAWANINKHGDITRTSNKRDAWAKTPLYAAQPAPVPHPDEFVCPYCFDQGPAPVPASGWVWQHRKGGEYTILGAGKIQCDVPPPDMADVVLYRASKDGTLWVRPEAEFNERFKRLRPLAAAAVSAADNSALRERVKVLEDLLVEIAAAKFLWEAHFIAAIALKRSMIPKPKAPTDP